MKCPRCSEGEIKGGTGVLFCPACHSVFSTQMDYLYSYKEYRWDEQGNEL